MALYLRGDTVDREPAESLVWQTSLAPTHLGRMRASATCLKCANLKQEITLKRLTGIQWIWQCSPSTALRALFIIVTHYGVTSEAGVLHVYALGVQDKKKRKDGVRFCMWVCNNPSLAASPECGPLLCRWHKANLCAACTMAHTHTHI